MIKSEKPTVAVWGHFHGGNLGDDLVVSTVVDAVRNRDPEARIIGISLSPADARARHGIEAFPINPGPALVHRRESTSTRSSGPEGLRKLGRRIPFLRQARDVLAKIRRAAREPLFALRAYRLLREVDLVVVAGSGAFADLWGPWQHPYTTFRWAGLARLARAPMAFLSVGASPIEARLSAFFFRHAIGWSSYLSARDHDAARILTSLDTAAAVQVVPDMAFGLPERFWPEHADTRRPPRDAMVVGLNVMAYGDPRYFRALGADRYHDYIGEMADLARSLLEVGHSVVLFSSQTIADELAALDVMNLLAAEPQPNGPLRVTMSTIRDLDDLVRVMAGCDLVVAARYHSVVLAILFGIPVIGIAYQAKTSELLRDLGYPERVFEIDQVSASVLMKTVCTVLARERAEPSFDERQRIVVSSQAVIRQFDQVFADILAPPVGLPLSSEGGSDSWLDDGRVGATSGSRKARVV